MHRISEIISLVYPPFAAGDNKNYPQSHNLYYNEQAFCLVKRCRLIFCEKTRWWKCWVLAWTRARDFVAKTLPLFITRPFHKITLNSQNWSPTEPQHSIKSVRPFYDTAWIGTASLRCLAVSDKLTFFVWILISIYRKSLKRAHYPDRCQILRGIMKMLQR